VLLHYTERILDTSKIGLEVNEKKT